MNGRTDTWFQVSSLHFGRCDPALCQKISPLSQPVFRDIRSTIQGEAVVAANYRSLTPSCAAGVGSCILQSTTLLLSSSDTVLLDGFMQFCCFVRKIWSESSPGKGCVFRSISYQELGEPGCYQPHFSAFPSAQNDRQDREISIGSSRRHRSSAPPQVYP